MNNPTQQTPQRAPELDWATPNSARIYDYMIGGKNNFEADRLAAERLIRLSPFVRPSSRENRHFLRRAVTLLARKGIRQFLDIGAGFPSSGNVHEITQQINPAARVVYVDNDPVVLAHARALMANDDKVRVVDGDARTPELILTNPDVRDFIDWCEPLGLVMVGLLHFVADHDLPQQIVQTFRERMAPGSFLALSHGSRDGFAELLPPSQVEEVTAEYEQSTDPLRLRTYHDIERMLDGFDLLQPGLVRLPLWRPDGISEGIPAEWCGTFGAVGHLPDARSGHGGSAIP